MAYEMKDNSGALFANFKKEKETQPDFKGDVMVDGIKKTIAAWKKTTKGGYEYLSLSFGEFKEQEAHQEKKDDCDKPFDDDMDVPF